MYNNIKRKSKTKYPRTTTVYGKYSASTQKFFFFHVAQSKIKILLETNLSCLSSFSRYEYVSKSIQKIMFGRKYFSVSDILEMYIIATMDIFDYREY